MTDDRKYIEKVEQPPGDNEKYKAKRSAVVQQIVHLRNFQKRYRLKLPWYLSDYRGAL